ncbi:sister chromatid cohesion protein DCC1 [Ischnura elegans]|uniref:sister chromatid cohesion protein DCC1 n=1 Tax=Ischnura elegans TaxID=197161 RepID=UPI001ED86812|nr:sister chromatid cohesion protein DCC1 [Ischnura elegans]
MDMDEEMEVSREGRRRELEDVSSVIALAKLDEKDLKPVSQALFFVEDDEESDFKILELNKELLECVQEGKSLVIRGLEDDEAVLCTDDATYEIRGAETSNSMLLIPELIFPDDVPNSLEERIIEEKTVISVIHNYFELRRCQPRVNKIARLLESSVYRGKEHENEVSGTMYSLEDLLDIVQCSNKELASALAEIEAYNINGYWRLLEFDYHFRVLTYILNLVEENSWPFDEVPKNETLESLSTLVPSDILEQCFGYYSEATGTYSDKGDQLFKLKEHKVCRFLAKVLLKPAGKFNLEEFLEAWQQSVPEGMKTSIQHLNGLALVNENESPPVAQYFPESELPDDPGKRFELLFHVKETWTLEAITPFIERLAPNKAGVSALLLKYARAYHSPNGKGRLYAARHSK